MRVQEFDFSANMMRALLWRHNDAVNLEQILTDKQANFDADNAQFWTDWVADVFDLRTANIFGLNVWAIILGINITIDPNPIVSNTSFGFGEFRINYFGSNFSSAAGNIVLSPDDARTVLRLRAHQLNTNATITAISAIMADVFGTTGGLANVYANDPSHTTAATPAMSMEYVFNFTPSGGLLQILADYDLLPRPAGVRLLSNVFPP